jgi:RimJ/RimL family protein N-acetyltransferase
VFTEHLRLEPITAASASDLWLVHGDEAVARWYGTDLASFDQVKRWAALIEESWHLHGVHKWIAYDWEGEVIGRGGLSRTPVDKDWGQIYSLLPAEAWARVVHDSPQPFLAHANWLEIGWALRRGFWGRGYATEIGRAGLEFAFDALGVQAVVSCTVPHNVRSRAVMERIGMHSAGEIRSPGMVEGIEGEQQDAPYAVFVLLRSEWIRSRTMTSPADQRAP